MKEVPLLACMILLAFDSTVLADPLPSIQPVAAESQTDERYRLKVEQRRRLRGELNEYSRKYPDSEQLDERRRMMLDRMQERFRSADGVGAITRSEAQLRMPKLARHFEQIDTNDDGVITREEMEIAHDRMQQKHATVQPEDADNGSRPASSKAE